MQSRVRLASHAARSLVLALLVLLAPSAWSQGGPLDAAQRALEERLAKDSYFQDVQWEVVRGGDGLAFVVQAPLKPEPGYARRQVGRIEVALSPLLRHFEAEYLRPHGLQRAEGRELLPVVVLPTLGTYRDYYADKQAVLEASYGSRFTFDGELVGPVVFVADGIERMDQAELRRSVGAPLLLAVMRAVRGERTSAYRWYAQGLAAHLSRMVLDESGRLQVRPLSATIVASLKRMFQERRDAIEWHGVADLAAVEGWGYLWRMVDARARALGADLPDSNAIMNGYGRAALALTMFLEEGPYRQDYRDYVADVLRGNTDIAGLLDRTGLSIEALDRDLHAWLGVALGLALEPPARARRAAPQEVYSEEAEVQPAHAAEEVGGGTDSPRSNLRVRGLDAELDHCLAVALAADGRIDDALRVVAESERPEDERLRGWLTAWSELRDAYLAAAISSGEPLRLELGGERQRVRIVAAEAGVVVIDDGKGEPRGVDLVDLDGLPLALALSASEAEELVEGGGWKRGIPLALTGHDRTRRTLRRSGEAGEALLGAAESTLTAARERGRVALVLEEVAASAEELELSQAELFVERLGAVAAAAAADPVLAEMQPALREAMRSLLGLVLAGKGAEAFLRAEVERSGGEGDEAPRIRVAWNFGEPRHALDLMPHESLRWRWEAMANVVRPEAEWGRRQRDDAVELKGKHGFLLPLALEPPLRLRLTYSTEWNEGMPGLANQIAIGVASDDGRDYLLGAGGWYVEVATGRGARRISSAEPPTNYVNQRYEMTLTWDGEEVVQTFAGVEVVREPMTDFRSDGGGILVPVIAVGADIVVLLEELVVEGVEGPGVSVAAGTAWVEARLAELLGE